MIRARAKAILLAAWHWLARQSPEGLTGLVLDVWVLTPAEAARKPWPVTPEQAQAWRFNPDAQTWTRP